MEINIVSARGVPQLVINSIPLQFTVVYSKRIFQLIFYRNILWVSSNLA